MMARYDSKLYLYVPELSILVEIRELYQDLWSTAKGTSLKFFSLIIQYVLYQYPIIIAALLCMFCFL